MKRLLFFTAVVLPSCALVAPSPGFVAQQVVPNPDGSALAIRVDIEEKERSAPKARYTLSPIPLDETGLVAQQIRSFPTNDADFAARKSSAKYDVLVRAYRPGYRTIEIRPTAESRVWQWDPADFLEQERAVDALLGVQCLRDVENQPWLTDVAKDRGWWCLIAMAPRSELSGSPLITQTLGDSGLLPGTVSAKHREVLLFAASEYERLANSPADLPAMEKARDRLKQKAKQMKRYADELTTQQFYRNQWGAAAGKR